HAARERLPGGLPAVAVAPHGDPAVAVDGELERGEGRVGAEEGRVAVAGLQVAQVDVLGESVRRLPHLRSLEPQLGEHLRRRLAAQQRELEGNPRAVEKRARLRRQRAAQAEAGDRREGGRRAVVGFETAGGEEDAGGQDQEAQGEEEAQEARTEMYPWLLHPADLPGGWFPVYRSESIDRRILAHGRSQAQPTCAALEKNRRDQTLLLGRKGTSSRLSFRA